MCLPRNRGKTEKAVFPATSTLGGEVLFSVFPSLFHFAGKPKLSAFPSALLSYDSVFNDIITMLIYTIPRRPYGYAKIICDITYCRFVSKVASLQCRFQGFFPVCFSRCCVLFIALGSLFPWRILCLKLESLQASNLIQAVHWIIKPEIDRFKLWELSKRPLNAPGCLAPYFCLLFLYHAAQCDHLPFVQIVFAVIPH